METDWMQLQATVQQFFYDVAQDPLLQESLNYTTSEQIMNKPT